MAGTPELSKIVEIIMQNPELISTISALVSKSSDTDAKTESEIETKEVSAVPEARENPPAIESSADIADSRSHRRELLGALKPYLSENRRAAIDSMISISDVLSMMRK